MASSPPVITFLADPKDILLVTSLVPRLAARGLTYAYSTPHHPLSSDQLIAYSTICVCVVSRVALASTAVQSQWDMALAAGRIVVPLLASRNLKLPPPLATLQWIDFSHGAEHGWEQMLVVLDSFGLASFPTPLVAVLDDEVVRARVLTGHTPPEWAVYRRYQLGWRRNTRQAWQMSILVLLVLIPPMIWILLQPVQLLPPYFLGIPIVGVPVLVWLAFSRFPTVMAKRDGESITITPSGVYLHMRGNHRRVSYHAVASIAGPVGIGYRGQQLVVTPTDGSLPYPVVIPLRFRAGLVIALQIIEAHQAYLQRLQGQPVFDALPRTPLVFVSYSRTDAQVADVIEFNLQVRNFRSWMDRSVLFGGQSWPGEIERAIDQAQAVIVVVSSAALRSTVVRHEYEYAERSGKPIIAVLAQQVHEMPSWLHAPMAADMSSSVVRGLLDLHRALDEIGLRAPYPSPQTPLDSGLVLSQAVRGRAPQGGHIFTARFPVTIIFVYVIVPVFVIEVLLSLFWSPLFALYLAYMWLVILSPAVIQRFRVPEMVVTMPEGLAFIRDSRRMEELPYRYFEILRVRASWTGITIACRHPVTKLRRNLRLGSYFPGVHVLATQIVDDYGKFTEAQQIPLSTPL